MEQLGSGCLPGATTKLFLAPQTKLASPQPSSSSQFLALLFTAVLLSLNGLVAPSRLKLLSPISPALLSRG